MSVRYHMNLKFLIFQFWKTIEIRKIKKIYFKIIFDFLSVFPGGIQIQIDHIHIFCLIPAWIEQSTLI